MQGLLTKSLFSNASSIFGPSISGIKIKSIQQVQAQVAVGQTTGTVTISAVDPTKTMLIFNGYTALNGPGAAYLKDYPSITLTNSTTVTVYTGSNSAQGARVNLMVVEFESGIKSIQYSSGGTISEVVVAKTIVLFLGWNSTSSSQSTGIDLGFCALTNSTTLSITALSPPGGFGGRACVVEFL